MARYKKATISEPCNLGAELPVKTARRILNKKQNNLFFSLSFGTAELFWLKIPFNFLFLFFFNVWSSHPKWKISAKAEIIWQSYKQLIRVLGWNVLSNLHCRHNSLHLTASFHTLQPQPGAVGSPPASLLRARTAPSWQGTSHPKAPFHMTPQELLTWGKSKRDSYRLEEKSNNFTSMPINKITGN